MLECLMYYRKKSAIFGPTEKKKSNDKGWIKKNRRH